MRLSNAKLILYASVKVIVKLFDLLGVSCHLKRSAMLLSMLAAQVVLNL